MMLTTILLFLVVILLVILISMQVSGWPAGRREKADATGRELHRDLAELRAEIMHSLHAIHGEIADLVPKDALKTISGLSRQLETVMMQQQQEGSRKIQKRSPRMDTSAVIHVSAEDRGEEEPVSSSRERLFDERQLTLFPAAKVDDVNCVETESTEKIEFISIPAADFDPDLDPPYDPDADAGNSSGREVF